MANAFAFGRDQWDPSHRFVTSWAVSPLVLGCIRALFALYAFATTFFIIGYRCTHTIDDEGGCSAARDELSYFTVLTYYGLAFYFLVSTVHTLTYALSGRPLLDRFPRPLQALHSLYYTSICSYPLIVTIVYWGVLFKGPWFDNDFSAWSNVSRHAMNAGFALFEIVLPRTDLPPWVHMFWLIFVLALYLGLAYFTVATRSFYVYPFLNPATSGPGMVAAYVFGIAVGCLLAYLLVKGLIWLRKWVTESKLGMHGKFSSRDNARISGAVQGDAEAGYTVKY